MRCKNCPYEDYDYQEGYPTCRLFGDDDEFIYENAKGELGCRFNQRGLQKYIRQHEEDEKVTTVDISETANKIRKKFEKKKRIIK